MKKTLTLEQDKLEITACRLSGNQVHVIMRNIMTKVSEPTSLTYLNQAPTFEWMVRYISKNIHQNDTSSKEIGLCAQTFLTF